MPPSVPEPDARGELAGRLRDIEALADAASGIEDEVRQGARIPLGTGFAGRVAASGNWSS